jgi:uncharacterized RDD family membrane protein YckC
LGSLLYETLTAVTLLLFASAIVTTLLGKTEGTLPRSLLQATALGMVSAYLLWCWMHGGQTLAMKTWRIKVMNVDGSSLNFRGALLRYLLAIVGLGAGGVGLWWALFDPDRQFLHDRLARTRLVFTDSVWKK